MDIILLLLQSTYFVVPAYFANMIPVIVHKLNFAGFLAKPIDHNKVLRDGKPLFGKNKTYRGFIFAVFAGIFGTYLQMYLFQFRFFHDISLIDYNSPLLLGFLMGFGAITGDLIKSFFKRRFNIQPGTRFVPWDQTDFIIGAYLFTMPFYYSILSWQLIGASIVASFFLHIIVNHISYYLKIRKEKW